MKRLACPLCSWVSLPFGRDGKGASTSDALLAWYAHRDARHPTPTPNVIDEELMSDLHHLQVEVMGEHPADLAELAKLYPPTIEGDTHA